jgi:hypothetical protein
MDKPRCRQPNRFKRLIAFLRRCCEQTVPSSWLGGGASPVLLEPPL